MTKRFILFLSVCLVTSLIHAQEWTKKDSLNLHDLLHGNGEIKLNPEAVKQIDFDSGILGAPQNFTDKNWMVPDETLPSALPDQPSLEMRQLLTLYPYKPTTPYNWDPVYRKKIKVGKDTWRGDPYYKLKTLFIYTNWAKTPLDAGERASIEQIEATGLRYNPLAGRVNNAMVGAWEGVGSSGIGGLDFNSIFTRRFWDRKGNIRRARTLEILKSYGDSTTVNVSAPVLQPITR